MAPSRTKGIEMKLKLGTVQFHHRANDKAYNLAVIERFALEAAAAGVKILALTDVHKLYERRGRVVFEESRILKREINGGPG
jgi:hypothetical protein